MGFIQKYGTYQFIKKFSGRGRLGSLFLLSLIPVGRRIYNRYQSSRSIKSMESGKSGKQKTGHKAAA